MYNMTESKVLLAPCPPNQSLTIEVSMSWLLPSLNHAASAVKRNRFLSLVKRMFDILIILLIHINNIIAKYIIKTKNLINLFFLKITKKFDKFIFFKNYKKI